MPFIQDDPNNPQNQPGQSAQTPVTTAAAPASGPAAGGKNAASNANPPQPFQNLQAYLGANENQIGDQANKISGDLTSQFGQTVSDVDKASRDFGSQVQGGSTPYDQNLVDQAASNPTGFASDPNNVANFQKQWANSYTGPGNFESTGGYGDVNREVQNAAANAGLVGTNSGLQTYLQNKAGGQYTQGDSTLDAALLRGNPNAITQVQNAAKPFSTLNDYLSQSVTGADQSVQDAINSANANTQNVQGRFTGQGGVVPTFQSNIDSGVSAAQKQASDRATAVKSALQSPHNMGSQVTDQALADLGLTRDQYTSLLSERDIVNGVKGQTPIDLSSYLTQQAPEVAINRGNFANADQYAQAAALGKLTGQDMTGFLDPANASKAGSANLNLSTLSPEAIKMVNDLYSKIPQGPGAAPFTPPSSGGGINAGDIINWGANPITSPILNPVIDPIAGGVNLISKPIINAGKDFLSPIGDAVGQIGGPLFGGGGGISPEQRKANEQADMNKAMQGMTDEQRVAYIKKIAQETGETGAGQNNKNVVSSGGGANKYGAF